MHHSSRRRTTTRVLVALTIAVTLLSVGASPAGAESSQGHGKILGAQPKIVGGTQAPAGAWPSQAALLDNRKSGSSAVKSQYCAGTVVNRSWILTAATCVYYEDGTRVAPRTIDVLVGSQNLASGGQRLHVSEVRVLPGFSTRTFQNNMAMLRLATPTSVRVQAVTAQGVGVPDGASMVVTGWGSTSASGSGVTDLRQATVTKLANSICVNGYGAQFHASSEICVSGAGQDTCGGDSGGPVLVRRGSAWVQVGVGRLSDGCGKYPATYTRVDAFGNWIRQQIDPPSTARVAISAKLSATHAVPGATVYLSGVVKPPRGTSTVVLQRYASGRWVDGGSTAVNQTTGAYRLPVRPATVGTYTLRVRSASGASASPTVRLVVAVPTVVKPSGCDPNYTPCVPIASDVDCAGGGGDGPAYVQGPVTVIGTDIYRLDGNHDGVGCE